ncbi:hypothetical protein [Arsenicicoccus dermatophilus]|uniref:hypothetical protein n=1 Tax=Arsenicicoccus dermatophilus TaxID=1076331 RepID=UPI00391714B2
MADVPPRYPWEISLPSLRLISTALAQGRPAALNGAPPRLNGLPDAEVLERYERLARACRERAAPSTIPAFEHLERQPDDRSPSEWETFLMRSGADDDPAVIELARDVWVALGPNHYSLCLRIRPRTYRGFVRGWTWAITTTAGLALLALIGQDLPGRGSRLWLLVLPAAAVWLTLLGWLFLRQERGILRHGGEELPRL